MILFGFLEAATSSSSPLLLFVFIFFLRQGLMYPKLALNWLLTRNDLETVIQICIRALDLMQTPGFHPLHVFYGSTFVN